MNPYMVALKIRKVYNTLNTYAYDSFDKLEPSMRVDINNMLDSLKDIANEIDKQEDLNFDKEDFRLWDL